MMSWIPAPKSHLPQLSLVVLLVGWSIRGACAASVTPSSDTDACGQCYEDRCPELGFCNGGETLDTCGCCLVCSDSKHHPSHVQFPKVVVMEKEMVEGGKEEKEIDEDKEDKTLNATDSPCTKVSCPKFHVCTENIQGLPVCACPGDFMCRRYKRKEVCGTDGKSYYSRCHMRIASCNQGVMVRKKHRGLCSKGDGQKDAVKYMRKVRKMKRRKQRKLKLMMSKKLEKNKSEGKKIKRKNKRRRTRRKSESRKAGNLLIKEHRKNNENQQNNRIFSKGGNETNTLFRNNISNGKFMSVRRRRRRRHKNSL